MNEDKMIRVWRWEDAPAEFRALSKNGGDEDWVALIPPAMNIDWIPWMDSGTSFGCCDVTEYPVYENGVQTGYYVRIGSHA